MANTEQLLSTGIGAAVGFLIGGPPGALAGAKYGFLAGSVLFPEDLPSVTGPRLEEFERAEADPGAAIWKVYGTYAVPGFRLYLGEPTEITNTETHGGKGAPEQEVTTFTYLQTIAIGLCEGVISDVTRIWENGELKYDSRGQQTGETDAAYAQRLAASAAYEATFTLYTGTETQEPDPQLEAELGAGNVPAFRGLAYLVFPNRTLTDDQGRRHPNFKIEVNQNSATESVFLAFNQDPESSANRVLRSGPGENAETWAYQPFDSPSPQQISAAAYSPSLGLVVGVGTNLTWVSEDNGLTWSEESVINDANWSSVVWVEDLALFVAVAVGTSSSNVAYSSDGYTWSYATAPNPNLRSIVWNPVHELLVIGGINNAYTSPDAMTWTERSTPERIYDLAVDDDGNMLGNNRDETGQSGGSLSTNGGVTWGSAWLPPGSGSQTIAYGNGIWVCANFQQGIYASSNPLTNSTNPWSLAYSYPGTAQCEHICFSQNLGLFVGVFEAPTPSGNYIVISEDGETWEEVDHAEGTNLDGVMVFNLGAGNDNSIESILSRICDDVGVANYDASQLADDYIHGYAVSRHMNARSAIEGLRLNGAFDIVESNNQIKFVKRGGAVVHTFATTELAPRYQGQRRLPDVTTKKVQDFELPRQIRLRFLSLARGYEKSETLSTPRIGTIASNDVTIDSSVSMSEETAAQLADIAQRDAWTGRHAHEWASGCALDFIEPGDPVLLPIDGRLYRVRVLTINEGRTRREYVGVRDDDGTYVSTAIASPPIGADPILTLLGDTSLVLLDLPALDEADDNAGLYLAAYRSGSGQGWTGATVYRSTDGGAVYNPLVTVAVQAVVGEVVSAPSADANTSTWEDGATLTVDIYNDGELESRTDSAVISGANTLAVGAHGRWCLIQFADANEIETGRYELSRLLIGRRATERHLATIQAADTVVLVSGPGIYQATLQSSQIGQALLYRAVTQGGSLAAATDVEFTGAGERLECFSPVNVQGVRDGSGNLTITWQRADRLDETLPDGTAVELSEATEAYEVDILDDDTNQTVLRTISSLTSPTASYSEAEQTTDFGSAQAAITVRVYQLSATVGRGAPEEAIV